MLDYISINGTSEVRPSHGGGHTVTPILRGSQTERERRAAEKEEARTADHDVEGLWKSHKYYSKWGRRFWLVSWRNWCTN